LIDAPFEAMAQVVDLQIAQAIVTVRNGAAKVTPGYDGVYGQLVLSIDTQPIAKSKPKPEHTPVKQKSMSDFW
jgi:PHP family Zn ribbon phosphoesterase